MARTASGPRVWRGRGPPRPIRKARRTNPVRICKLDLTSATEPDALSNELRRIAALGFSHVLCSGWPAPLADDRDALGATAALCAACERTRLSLLLDLSLDRCPVQQTRIDPDWIDRAATASAPHETDSHLPGARLRWHDAGVAEALSGWWAAQLGAAFAAGVAGFCLRAPHRVAGRHWKSLTAMLHAAAGAAPDGRHPRLLVWTPGLSPAQLEDLAQGRFDGAFCSLPWWDFRSSWLSEEIGRLRRFGRVLAATSLTAAVQDALTARRALWSAAALCDGILVPAGFETAGRQGGDLADAAPSLSAESGPCRAAGYDITDELLQANTWLEARGSEPALSVRQLTGSHAPLTALLRLPLADADRGSDALPGQDVLAVVINPSAREPGSLGADRILGSSPDPAARLEPSPGSPAGARDGAAMDALDALAVISLAAGDIRLYRAVPVPARPPVTRAARQGEAISASGLGSVVAALEAPRIVIEQVAPCCDAGRFAVRRVVGERVEVSADIWMDGHAQLAACVLWRAPGEQDWHEAPMRHVVNDRWRGAFPLAALGRHEFTVEAWHDTFASWLDEIAKKLAAGVDITLEIEEGARLVADALLPPGGEPPPPDGALAGIVDALAASAGDDARRLEILLAAGTAAAMRAAMQHPSGRPFATRHPVPMPVEAERLATRFASWYELFPRSQSGSARRHGTFDDVIARLPAIRAMGFDVLYFPPIHPIGRTHRKGRNNSLRCEPGDPGSPYAIGAQEGGHDALHPELGTFEDFHRLRDAAAAAGLELALDFAVQCSLDHPWLKAHPEWFARRPDGSLRYAENPPKKYEDIVNPDFYAPAPAATALWQALRDVVMFWLEQGVRIFRVDNPHTKPLPFWEWMIEDVRAHYPDAIFLSEAFTRPKMMARLAKVGFSQSYTYFTWRNTKAELMEYLTELTQGPLREYFRPHFFVNTPDINPPFLHEGGRPAFLIRAALAALLSGLWGMYSGFELCESEPLVVDGKVREEYLDSEKYQLRPRNWQQPGNIVAEITRLNLLRLQHPALQSHLGLRFYHAGNDAILYFARFVPGEETLFGDDVLLVAINLDPRHAQEASIEIPLWEWGLPDQAGVSAQDLMSGHHFKLNGKQQHIRLDPAHVPFALWQVTPIGGARRAAAAPAEGGGAGA